MKKSTLIKVAISFKDTRGILNKMKQKGIKLERNDGNHSIMGTQIHPGPHYNPDSKTVHIPRNFADGKKWHVRNILAHEHGHATQFLKGKTKLPETPDRQLKLERAANSNALHHITDKKSRNQFKQESKSPYSSYKANFVIQKNKKGMDLAINKGIDDASKMDMSQLMSRAQRHGKFLTKVPMDRQLRTGLTMTKKSIPGYAQSHQETSNKFKGILRKQPWKV